jgi:hypothetical protein
MKRVTYIAFVIGLFTTLFGASFFAAQTSATAPDQPLGDYARKVHKDADAAKAKPKVFDNDNLPKDDKLSVVGQPPDAASAAPADSGDKSASAETKDGSKPATTTPAPSADDEQAKKQAAWKSWQEKLGSQKEQIDLTSRELDVLQREYQLRAAEMYADVGNRLRNSAQWDKQEAEYKQKIADKQKAVEDGKQKLADMQEEARKAGVPASMTE